MLKNDSKAYEMVQDERTRRAVSLLLTNKDEATRKYILTTYEDPELHNIYNAMRAAVNMDDKLHKSGDRKLTIKFPNPTVFKFVEDIMKVKYGEDWLQEPKIFYDELVVPWVIRSR